MKVATAALLPALAVCVKEMARYAVVFPFLFPVLLFSFICFLFFYFLL
jgi:hypothetical protein